MEYFCCFDSFFPIKIEESFLGVILFSFVFYFLVADRQFFSKHGFFSIIAFILLAAYRPSPGVYIYSMIVAVIYLFHSRVLILNKRDNKIISKQRFFITFFRITWPLDKFERVELSERREFLPYGMTFVRHFLFLREPTKEFCVGKRAKKLKNTGRRICNFLDLPLEEFLDDCTDIVRPKR